MMSRKRVIGVALLASCGVILGACAPQADDTMSDGSTPQPMPSQSGQSGQSGDATPESGPDAQEQGTQPINGDAWVNELEDAPSQPGETPAIFHDMRVSIALSLSSPARPPWATTNRGPTSRSNRDADRNWTWKASPILISS